MDRSRQLQHLADAERHIADGARHIFEQELRLAFIERRGHDSKLARDLLETFRRMQVQHVAHRDVIVNELGEYRPVWHLSAPLARYHRSLAAVH